MKEQLYYTGVGSRTTPREICEVMEFSARALSALGYILRSGGADGADSAFEDGARFPVMSRLRPWDTTEIFLPWRGFNGRGSELFEQSDKAREIAYEIVPYLHNRDQSVQKLFTRNVHQVLGRDIGVSPVSKFLICWTEDGLEVGGTRIALAVARLYGVPIINLGDEEWFDAEPEDVVREALSLAHRSR